jgi:hypothetical protein
VTIASGGWTGKVVAGGGVEVGRAEVGRASVGLDGKNAGETPALPSLFEMGRVYPPMFFGECASGGESMGWKDTENRSAQAVENVRDAGVGCSNLWLCIMGECIKR